MSAKGKKTDHGGEQAGADRAAERATLQYLPPRRKHDRARFNHHRNHQEYFHCLSLYGLKDKKSTCSPASGAVRWSLAAESAAAAIETKTEAQTTQQA